MREHGILIILGSVLIISFTYCKKENEINSETNDVSVKQLINFDNLISNKELLLGLPIRLKYDDDTHHLFIQDPANWSIIEIDDSSKVVNKFGRQGRGPGELQELSDFFITKNHLFIIDAVQHLIHRYRRHDGQHISSLDYGAFLLENKNSSSSKILLPPKPSLMDNNNQPFITLNEMILLPSVANGKFLYQTINWDGDKLAGIGEIPAECVTTEDNNNIRALLENREVPARDTCLAFPVNDYSNPEEIFLVYSAIPKIAKYTLSGEKIWEQQIPQTPEVDSLMIDISNIVKSRPNHPVSLLPVRKYIAGRSSPHGNLYLITYTNLHTPIVLRPLWVHQFDSRGNLINRYEIVSDDDDFYYFPGIDFERRRAFIPMHEQSNVRVYYF